MSRRSPRRSEATSAVEPDWYRDAVVYQLHVKAFHDSDDDGTGDFAGLTDRLDYLQELGVTALWLLPFYPSPRRDDGYDTADYKAVHPEYGDLRSFRRFLDAAHDRDLRVITELVINHTSDEHPWFQRARRAQPGTRARDFYVWSDDAERYRDARIIFPDFETSNWAWDPVAGSHYWHRFYSHQPDLNFDNPAVHDAVFDALDFWLSRGVDGLRLDAIPYLYEREGTNCENLPETHEFLRRLRAHVDERHPNRMLLAEANQWPEDAVAYFGEGDECHMSFHFPLMPRLFMALQMEDRFPVVEILEQTPAIPDGAQWATFLRNHDELTLEMVTDEERDFMYRAYAQDRRMRVNLGIRRRLAPLLDNDRRKIELLNGLLFSLPGTPIVYYGDEIGMGDNVWLGDRDGVRTPMQWNADRNAGFSRANPQSLYLPVIIDPAYHYEKVNVEAELAQPSSLLRWMRQLIALRRRSQVFGRGSIEFLHPDNSRVLAFVREHGDDRVLVVANLSRFAQAVELDLTRWAGLTPVEMFGATPFPPVGALPYLVTLGPYQFLWFGLERQRTEAPVITAGSDADAVPTLRLGPDEHPFRGRARGRLARLLPRFLADKRWFAGKARTVQSVHVADLIPLPPPARDESGAIALVEVEFRDGDPATYVLPLAIARGDRAAVLLDELAHGVVARVEHARAGTEVVYEALWSPAVHTALLALLRRRRPLAGERGELRATPGPALRALLDGPPVDARILRAEQSNTSLIYGEQSMLKLYRRIDAGLNPEVEIGRHLARVGFEHVPALGGALEYRPRRGDPRAIAVLQGYVPNEGDAWRQALDALARYFADVADADADAARPLQPDGSLLEASELEVPDAVSGLIGPYLGSAALLGTRTAELHRALAQADGDPDFEPVPFSQLDRRALYQSMRSRARRTLQLLARSRARLPEPLAGEVDELLGRDADLFARYDPLLAQPLTATRIRTHGDYHLGQVLRVGADFVILDFEGEPTRPVSERRLKRSALRDVAGMARSFDYAVQAAAREAVDRGLRGESAEDREALDAWGALWSTWVSATFVGAWRSAAADASFVPDTSDEERVLLDAFLLDKACYELGYELEQRPDWVEIPLRAVRRALDP